MNPSKPEGRERVLEACPHCGEKLSPWQQVLLSVDRALMCTNCWYRIMLDANDNPASVKKPQAPSAKE